jgi:hypothetical protein
MVAARGAGRPLSVASGTVGGQVIGVQPIETTTRQSQRFRGCGGRQLLGAEPFQDMTNQRRCQTMSQLGVTFFSRPDSNSLGGGPPPPPPE